VFTDDDKNLDESVRETMKSEAEATMNWNEWWEKKDIVNFKMLEGIEQMKPEIVEKLLDENKNQYGVAADIELRLDN